MLVFTVPYALHWAYTADLACCRPSSEVAILRHYVSSDVADCCNQLCFSMFSAVGHSDAALRRQAH